MSTSLLSMEDENDEEQVVVSASATSLHGSSGENVNPNVRLPPPRASLPHRFGRAQYVPTVANNTQEHVIHLAGDQQEQVQNPTLVGAPLLHKISSSTRNALHATTQRVNMGLVAEPMNHIVTGSKQIVNGSMQLMSDSVNLMTGSVNTLVTGSVNLVNDSVNMLQTTIGLKKKNVETYVVNTKSQEAKEKAMRLKLQAFWQLLLTGFEVLKFPAGSRARKRIMWLTLDGKLYLDKGKKDKKAFKYMVLSDIYKIQKGVEATQFTKSLSWRDVRGKEHLSFSIHAKCGREERVFAIQVQKPGVRNILVENFENLIRMTKSDTDGEFPIIAQKRLALHYAATGDVLTLIQLQQLLTREDYNLDNPLASMAKKAREMMEVHNNNNNNNVTEEEKKSDNDSNEENSDMEEQRNNILG